MLQPTSFLYAGADLPDLWSNIMSSLYTSIPLLPLPLYPSSLHPMSWVLGHSAPRAGAVVLRHWSGAKGSVSKGDKGDKGEKVGAVASGGVTNGARAETTHRRGAKRSEEEGKHVKNKHIVRCAWSEMKCIDVQGCWENRRREGYCACRFNCVGSCRYTLQLF